MKCGHVNVSTQSVLCDPELIEARDAHFRRLDDLFTGKRPERPVFLQGVGGDAQSDPYTQPERWVDQTLNSLADKAQQLRCAEVFRPLCVEFGAYNVHFTDRIFGARVHQDDDGVWWAERIEGEVGGLSMPDLDSDPTWALERSVAEAFAARAVTVPLFGMPVIAGALTVAVSLYGPRFLAAMLDEPAAARHDLAVINAVTIQLYRWYQDHIPVEQLQQVGSAWRCMPPGHVSVYGCTSHLVSAALYRESVAPFDAEVLAASSRGGLIHLCGDHCRHIDAWRRMRPLRAVQLNDRASADLEHYFTGLRDDQVIYLSPTDTMTARRALDITEGRRIVIVSDAVTEKGTDHAP